LTEISSRAFSAKSGQSEAGSTTTASSFLPSRPPFSFCSSMSMSMTSFSVVSEIAIVPDSECRTPTLIVSSCAEAPAANASSAANAVPERRRLSFTRTMTFSLSDCPPAGAKQGACQRLRGVQGEARRVICLANRLPTARTAARCGTCRKTGHPLRPWIV
jgi:hypothetical protein